jgi:hypothetical protein
VKSLRAFSHFTLVVLLFAEIVLAQTIVKGTVADASGRRIAGATVRATTFSGADLSVPNVTLGITGSDGSFTISAPVSNRTFICVGDAGKYLDPCQWNRPINVTKDAGNLSIALTKGARLRLRVIDSLRLAEETRSQVRGRLELAAFLPAITYSTDSGKVGLLNLSSAGPGIFEYSAIVPTSIALTLSAVSNRFILRDRLGNVVSAPFRVEVGKGGTDISTGSLRLPWRLDTSGDSVVELFVAGLK